jgi:hypothetical protein
MKSCKFKNKFFLTFFTTKSLIILSQFISLAIIFFMDLGNK